MNAHHSFQTLSLNLKKLTTEILDENVKIASFDPKPNPIKKIYYNFCISSFLKKIEQIHTLHHQIMEILPYVIQFYDKVQARIIEKGYEDLMITINAIEKLHSTQPEPIDLR